MEDEVAGNNNSGSVVAGFLLGALVGAGAALLLAPASGDDTRDRLRQTGKRVRGAVRDTLDGARDQVDRARDAVTELKHNVGSALTS
jgi:gas vesicle protein